MTAYEFTGNLRVKIRISLSMSMQNNTISNKASYIKNKRVQMGLTPMEFAIILDMQKNGERTVRGWESGEHKPTESKFKKIVELKENSPFKISKNSLPKFTFIDLFAGIGGIRLPFQELGGKCVFSSEWDKFSQKTYAANFGEVPEGDITKISSKNIYPGKNFDILLGGFPCQAFSQAGLKKGFNDTRGTMFFEIQRILTEKKPKAFLLENVKQLKGHNKGETLKTIKSILNGEHNLKVPKNIPMSEEARNALSKKLNYWVDIRILRAADFGIPQNRERIFIVGFDKNHYGDNVDFNDIYRWPEPPKKPTKVKDILEQNFVDNLVGTSDRYTISDKLWQGHKRRKKEHKIKGNGFGYTLYTGEEEYTNTISARYYKDGSEILIDQSHKSKNPRKLTPKECAKLQGFPDEFIVDAVSHGQIYKQFGNSVCVKVVKVVAEQIIDAMNVAESRKVNVI